MYDTVCSNGHQKIDVLEPISMTSATREKCATCGEPMERAWLTKPSGVIGDDIPGGTLVYHTLCNDDGSPRRYYSKSEMARAAKAKGYHNHVEHVPSNPGTDKSKHTSRWI